MGTASYMDLQTSLAAGNPPTSMTMDVPHHPISCRDELLWLETDGRMGCAHGQVPADDPRTRGCIDQSVAILLIELAVEKEASSGGC